MPKTLTIKEFIKMAKSVHGEKYDYSQVQYKGNKMPVIIKCPIHGIFYQTPHKHLCGHGCPKCGGTNLSNSEDFIEKAKSIHGTKYDYSKVKYVNAKEKVCIICPEHGEFFQKPNNHLNGQGCPKCGHSGKWRKSDTKTFIGKSEEIHNKKYDYSKVKYVNNRLKVCIICPTHGEFWQVPAYHLSGNGCPKCKASWLEREISMYLDKHSVKYEYEKRFSWLEKKSLDFYLPDYNIAIECQGIQHFFPVQYFGGIEKYNSTVVRDREKQESCSKNGITLYYYTHENFEGKNVFHNIHELFENIIKNS